MIVIKTTAKMSVDIEEVAMSMILTKIVAEVKARKIMEITWMVKVAWEPEGNWEKIISSIADNNEKRFVKEVPWRYEVDRPY